MSLIEKYKLPAVFIRKEDVPSMERGITLLEAYSLWAQYAGGKDKPLYPAYENATSR